MRKFHLSPDDSTGTGDSSKAADKPDEVAALRARVAEYEAAEAKRKADAAKAAEEEARKRGDFERLLAEKEEKLGKLAEYEKREAARLKRIGEKNEAKLKALPKDRHSLIPDVLKADPDALADYLEANWTLLTGVPAGEGTDKPGTKPKSGDLTDEQVPADIAADARRRGMAPSAWYKILVNAGRIKQPATS